MPAPVMIVMIGAFLLPVIAGEVVETNVSHRYFCQIQPIETITAMRITQR